MKRTLLLSLPLFAAALFAARATTSAAQAFVFRVTDVSLRANYLRPTQCPLTVSLSGYVTANGPGVVRYAFVHSEGPGVLRDAGEHELVFSAAGTQRVGATWTFNDLGGAAHYDGWAAIRILSPNPLESNHATGAFSLDCQSQQSQGTRRREQTVVTPRPAGGRFLITVNGFRVNHQTVDDALERDGAGDEVYLTDAVAEGHGYSRGAAGPRYGQLRDWDHNRIQAGRATPTGGLRTGDSYPAVSPEVASDAALGRQFTIPGVISESEITSGGRPVVLIPSIWEWDSNEDALHRPFDAMFTDPALARYVAGFVAGPPRTRLEDYIKHGSEMGLTLGVTLGHGPLGLGEVGNRPIGMKKRDADTYVFDPQVLILTYEAADMISRTDFGHGPGVFEMRFVDDRDLQGDYTLFLQVKRLP